MTAPVNTRAAVSAIERRGVLLAFPIDNRPEPPSLWSHFYPGSQMRWEWDQEGDGRVVSLWHLRERLSRSRKVVYTKWYRDRATFFSRPMFVAAASALRAASSASARDLSRDAALILEELENDSPLSTKALKRRVDLEGRVNERAYTKAMRELWSRLLVVGYGEVDEGAFPSLAIGATKVLFEDLWSEAEGMAPEEGEAEVRRALGNASLFVKHFERVKKAAETRAPTSAG